MHRSFKLGALIQEYGRFTVHEFWVQKGEQLLPLTKYRISLKQPDELLLPVASIPVRDFDRERVIASIHSWLRGQAYQIAQTKHSMSETQDPDIIEKYQARLARWEPRYKMVLQALQEIDPSAHIEEPRALYHRNISYSHQCKRVFPVVDPGTPFRDFGSFRIYEVHESRNGEALPLSHDMCFVPPNGDVVRLGNTRLPDMSFSSLMSFLHSWLALRERALKGAKEELLTATDPERLAQLQRIISWNEDLFFPVLYAVEKLEADPDLNRDEKSEEEEESMHLSLPKLGALIQEYGRFAVHETWVQKGEQLLPLTRYRISLKQPDGSLLPVASIPVRDFDRERVIECIHFWLRSRSHQIALTRQWMSETQDPYIIEKYQARLARWEPRYKMVLQALQEIDPSAHIEEPRALSHRNVSYTLHCKSVFPVVEPGTPFRDFGLFRIYEVHESRNGEALPLSHDVCFVPPNGDVVRLGNTRLPDMSFSSLMSFLHSWRASGERALKGAKEELLTATDPERLAQLPRLISWLERSFFPVLHAVEKLEADPDLNRDEKSEEE